VILDGDPGSAGRACYIQGGGSAIERSLAIRLIVRKGGPARMKKRRSNPIAPPGGAGGFRADGRPGRGVGVRIAAERTQNPGLVDSMQLP